MKTWWEWLDFVTFHEIVDSLMSDHGLIGTVGELPVELADLSHYQQGGKENSRSPVIRLVVSNLG